MILFISHDAGRTGAPIALLHILRWLRDNSDLSFDILLKCGGELSGAFSSISNTYTCESASALPFSKLLGLASDKPRIPRAVRRKNYSLLYSNTVTNGFLIADGFSSTLPLITHCHEMDYWMSQAGDQQMRMVVERTTKFIACSKPSALSLERRGASREKIEIIPGPFIPQLLPPGKQLLVRRDLGIPDDSFVVISGGAEGWRKGKDLFVQLAALLNNQNTRRFDLIWLGTQLSDDFEYWLHASAEYAGISEYVHWQGSVSNPEAYLALADCFVLLSREDPMPLIAIEAGSMGLPVVCFKSAGGTSEWVELSGGGLVVNYLDVSQAAQQLVNYSDNRDLLRRDGARAQSYCAREFQIDCIGERVLSLINGLLP